jgi:phosphopantothenoylcysteine decarboxylase/phosphopantothenate--cysteine ligase
MQVTLVHGPVELTVPRGVRTRKVTSAADMWTACAALWPMHDVLIMAAAVADYTPTRPARAKRKKSAEQLTLKLKPTVDILSRLARKRRRDQVVIGFALEDRAARRNAEKKLLDKQLDAIVLNRPDAIAARRTALEVLVLGDRWREWAAAAKERHAARLVDLAARLAEERVTD